MWQIRSLGKELFDVSVNDRVFIFDMIALNEQQLVNLTVRGLIL